MICQSLSSFELMKISWSISQFRIWILINCNHWVTVLSLGFDSHPLQGCNFVFSALLLQNNSHSPGRGEEHHHCWPCPSLRSTPSPECLCLCSAAFSGANFWHKRYDCSVACSWPKWTKMAFRNTILLQYGFTLFLVTSALILRKKELWVSSSVLSSRYCVET